MGLQVDRFEFSGNRAFGYPSLVPRHRGTRSQPIIWLEKSYRREWRMRSPGQLSKCGP
jgi:hypothetical protein